MKTITPEQMAKGYTIKIGDAVFKHRQYRVVRKLFDGTYLVRDPDPHAEFHELTDLPYLPEACEECAKLGYREAK